MYASRKTLRLASAAVPVLVLVATNVALASSTNVGGGGGGGGTLPWEGYLSTLVSALTGTTAKLICVIAIFVAGIALIFGEDLGHFAKRLLMIVIASAFLIGAGGFVGTFLGGAHI